MRSRLPALALLALLVSAAPRLAAPAPPQHSGPPDFPLVDDDVSTLICGEFTGDTHADAVVIANGKPVLRAQLETQETYIWSSVPAVDLARIPGGGVGGRDRVAVVGSTGLALLEFNSATGLWSSTTLRGLGTWWPAVIALRAAQVDGINGVDLVGVTNNRVVIARSDANGGWTLLSDLTFLVGSGVTGVELMDWDGAPGGACELAVLLAAGGGSPARVRVMRPDGTSFGTTPCAGLTLEAAVVGSTSIGRRYIAAVSTDATGAQQLGLWSSYDVVGVWPLGHAGIHDIAAGDWTGDGVDDLVLATTASRDAQLHVVLPNGPTQLELDPLDTPPNPLPVGHPYRPLLPGGEMDFADIDHDGDQDLVTAVQGDYAGGPWVYLDPHFSAVEITRNARVNELASTPWPAPGATWPSNLPVPVASPNWVELYVSIPHPPGAFGEFEYELWHTPDVSACVDSSPMIAKTVHRSAGNYTMLSFLVGPLADPVRDRFTLIVRMVERDAADHIVSQSPAAKVTLYSDVNELEYSSAWSVLVKGDFPSETEPEEQGGHSSGPGLPPGPSTP